MRRFHEEYGPYLQRTLMARCGDSRSRAEAEDIADAVIADCFGASGKGPLLIRYDGRSTLRSWLFLIGLNRLKSWWRSAHFRLERQVGDMEEAEAIPSEDGVQPWQDIVEENEVVEILHKAFEAVIKIVPERDIAYFRMIYCYGLTQLAVAEMWDCDCSTVGRRIKTTAEFIHDKVMRYLELLEVNLEITWEDCLTMCAVWPNLLMGDDEIACSEELRREKLDLAIGMAVGKDMA